MDYKTSELGRKYFENVKNGVKTSKKLENLTKNVKIILHFLSDSGTTEYIYLLNGSSFDKNNDQVEVRDSKVSENVMVRDTGF